MQKSGGITLLDIYRIFFALKYAFYVQKYPSFLNLRFDCAFRTRWELVPNAFKLNLTFALVVVGGGGVILTTPPGFRD